MKCDSCQNEATVHEVTISGGVRIERHLCEACARETGLVSQGPAPLQEILQKFASAAMGQTQAAPAEKPKTNACETCGTTFAEFKQSGRLGCPACYDAFTAQLGPILDRAHEGATHHIGKVPRRALRGLEQPDDVSARAQALAAAEARAQEMRRLREDLDKAVKSEAYEQAAAIRDRIRRLQRGAGTPGEAP